jgi:hypothetical protein
MGKTIFTCVYIGEKSLRIFFSRTSRPISIILDTKKREFQFLPNKGPGPL